MIVQKVHVPGYLISPMLLSSHTPTSLSAFGGPPFSILCQANHLETNPAPAIIGNAPPIQDILAAESDSLGLLEAPETLHMCNDNNARFDPLSLDSPPFVLRHEPDFDAFLVMDAEQPALDSAVDPTTLAVISQMIIDVVQYEPQSQSLIHSRFKGDIWHLFHQFNIPLSHGLRRPFARALSAALFLSDPNDKQAVEEVLQGKGSSYGSKLKSQPWWIHSRVCHYIRLPKSCLVE